MIMLCLIFSSVANETFQQAGGKTFEGERKSKSRHVRESPMRYKKSGCGDINFENSIIPI